MLKDNVLEKINDQFNHELASAYAYYAMAAYFEAQSLKGFANWMIKQSQEELVHAHRLYNYIIDKGGQPRFDRAEAPRADWDSPLAVFEDAYRHECLISEKINECVALAATEEDYATTTMLQWFVNEQVEEEATADELVQKLRLIGDNPSALFMMDTELGKRTFNADAATG